MKSHELARLLLTFPDLPIATHANNHTFMSVDAHWDSTRIGVLTLAGHNEYIVIGNFDWCDINAPNWYVEKLLYGEAIPLSTAKMEWLRSHGWTKETRKKDG